MIQLVQIIVDAIAAGAAGAAAKGIAGDAVKAGYDAVKKYLGPKLWWKSIEADPSNPTTRATITAEIAPLSDLLSEDPQFLALLTALLEAIDRVPPEAAASAGIIVKANKANLDFIVRNISATGTIAVTDNVAGGDIVVEGITAGETTSKKA